MIRLNAPPTKSHVEVKSTRRPLEGRRVCLVFDQSISHYSRLHLEVEALQLAGASVRLLTQQPVVHAPPGVTWVRAPLGAQGPLTTIGRSRIPVVQLRRIDDAVRAIARYIAARLYSKVNYVRYQVVLRRIAQETDVFWVIDFPRLQTIINAAQRNGARIVYETVDLVPEYMYHGSQYRQASLDTERRLISRIDGFITACDSYAEYYEQRYAHILRRRPVVRDNMPRDIVTAIVPTGTQLRLLFFGSLLIDRPLIDLIDAIAATTADVTLTFQGKNYLGNASARRISQRIDELGLRGRVTVLDPCPPDAIVATASAYDVGIVALRGIDENERLASTSKLFTYMAAGLAILGSNLPGIARIVHAHDNGLLVDGMTPLSWAAAIDRLGSTHRELIDRMKRRSVSAAALYAWDEQEPAFVQEFVRALSGPRKQRPYVSG